MTISYMKENRQENVTFKEKRILSLNSLNYKQLYWNENLFGTKKYIVIRCQLKEM